MLEYNPIHFLKIQGIEDEKDSSLLLKEIYYSDDWKKLDLGLVDEEDVFNKVKKAIPERLHDKAYKLIYFWKYMFIPIEETEKLIEEIKDDYKFYLLSNASINQPNYWNDIPASKYFKGTVISGLVKCSKPDHKIFEILLNKYDLKAEECLFIDDSLKNVEAAKELGIDGYYFDGDINKFRDYLKR